MTPEAIAAHVATHLPGFIPTGDPRPLSGGLMNFVWRLRGRDRSVIVKIAPPHIAALPTVPLDPKRVHFEAYCLQAFATHADLITASATAVRPPQLHHFDDINHILILEDVGESRDLGHWLQNSSAPDKTGRHYGITLGKFIGNLHAATFQDKVIRASLNNIAIQQSRHEGQYRVIGDHLRRSGVADASELGARALDLGQRFLGPGRCMIMGDLWPPSILMVGEGMRIIDWEFAHFGQPAQDIAHLTAHLWMLSHRAVNEPAARLAQATLDGFLHGYGIGTGERLPQLLGGSGLHDCAVHFGAEILARTVGPYQPGYLYDGLPVTHPVIREVVACAAAHIRSPESTATFSFLSPVTMV